VRVTGHGLSVDVPSGWEVRIFRRAGGGPILHVATFLLEDGDGDFGAAATGRMGPGDCFAALIEYRDSERIRPGVGLFQAIGRPPAPRLPDFAPTQLQVTRRGQQGWQRFFTDGGRTCCLYAVIQPGPQRLERLIERLAHVLGTLQIAPRADSS
jgi:hypothetical protein